jgi:outer membrane protein assembly factor BamE
MRHLTDPREARPVFRPHRAKRVSMWAMCMVAAGLAGCSTLSEKLPAMPSVANMVTPYKIDIQQGNVVTREQAQALQPGMPRQQVRDLLGSPLLTSVFHADRWDYVFTFRRQGQVQQQRKVAVFFKGDVLERFEADELPSEAEFVASLDVKPKNAKVPVLVATEEQLNAFHEANKPAATSGSVEVPTASPSVNYPPLESPGASR